MKKLNRSILVCFLDLIDILIKNPSSSARNQKLNDMRLLFVNLNHLINEMRPNQAQEALRIMMMKQKHETSKLLDEFEEKLAEAKELIVKSIENLKVFNPDDCEAFKLSGLLEPGSCRLNESIETTTEYSIHDYTINMIKYLDEICNLGREDSEIQSELKRGNIDCKSEVLDSQESNWDLGATGEKAYLNSKLSARNNADMKIENADISTSIYANTNQKDMEFTEDMKVPVDYIGLSNSLLAAKRLGQLALGEVKAMEEDKDLSQCKQDVMDKKTCTDMSNKECNVKLDRKSKDSCSEDIDSSKSKSVDVCFSQIKQDDENGQLKQEAERDSKYENEEDLSLLQGTEKEVSLIQIRQGQEGDMSLEKWVKDDLTHVQSKQSTEGELSLMKSVQDSGNNLESKQGDVLVMQNKKAEGDSKFVSPNRKLEDDAQFMLCKQESERELLFEETSGNLDVMENRDPNVEESKEEIYDNKNTGKNKEEIYDFTNVRESKGEITDDTDMGKSKGKECEANARESKENIYDDTNIWETKEVTDIDNGVVTSKEEMTCDKY